MMPCKTTSNGNRGSPIKRHKAGACVLYRKADFGMLDVSFTPPPLVYSSGYRGILQLKHDAAAYSYLMKATGLQFLGSVPLTIDVFETARRDASGARV